MMATVKCATLFVLLGSALARPDGTGGHHGDHHGHHAEHAASAPVSAPASGYAEPAAAYSAPASSYGAPASSYGAPASSYGAPDPGYGAPEPAYSAPSASGYGAPATGYGYEQTEPEGFADTGIDLTTLIIPILVIAGLALLFPSTTTVAVNKRKRSADETDGPGLAERMLDIMESVTTSEQCMERIACEVGGIADQYGMDKTMTKIAEKFVSKKAHKLMKKFNGSEDCRKIKCGMF